LHKSRKENEGICRVEMTSANVQMCPPIEFGYSMLWSALSCRGTHDENHERVTTIHRESNTAVSRPSRSRKMAAHREEKVNKKRRVRDGLQGRFAIIRVETIQAAPSAYPGLEAERFLPALR